MSQSVFFSSIHPSVSWGRLFNLQTLTGRVLKMLLSAVSIVITKTARDRKKRINLLGRTSPPNSSQSCSQWVWYRRSKHFLKIFINVIKLIISFFICLLNKMLSTILIFLKPFFPPCLLPFPKVGIMIIFIRSSRAIIMWTHVHAAWYISLQPASSP